ncbi:MAG: SCP2 sterol-binding domain-containing protein [Thermoplasmata archaeon]|nr:MAG: SCP2 sterol-binding domain-containing protein [Thermoplasmata archaeon]
MVKELLENAVEQFNEKSAADEKFRKEVEGKTRTIQFTLDDGRSWNFKLDDGHIDGVHDGPLEGADISITTDEETIRGIFDGSISPMRAYALKKIKFKASLQDLLTLRKLF